MLKKIRIWIKQQQKEHIFLTRLLLFFSFILTVSVVWIMVTLYRPYPSANNLTPAQITKLTTYSSQDTAFEKQLKSNALDTYLSTGQTTYIKSLNNNKKLLNQLSNGTLPLNQLNSAQTTLKMALSATNSQIAQIVEDYDEARLLNDVNALNNLLSKGKTEKFNQIASLAQQVSTEAENVIQAYENNLSLRLSSNVGKAIIVLNAVNSTFTNFTNFETAIRNYQTITMDKFNTLDPLGPFMQNFQSVYSQLSSYMTAKQSVESTMQKMQNFQKQWSAAQQLQNNSVSMPNLVGQTLQEAQNQTNGNYNIQVSSGPTDDTAVILLQSPDPTQFPYLYKGQTIQVTTQDNQDSVTVPSVSESSSEGN